VIQKETKDRRALENHEKYQKVWESYEKRIDTHFERKEKEELNKNKPVKDQALIRVDLARKL
jgi:hypothetical protein